MCHTLVKKVESHIQSKEEEKLIFVNFRTL
ncbi:hypothetical protein OCHUTO_0717 [Orientia chuto str. Dubai]|uniref:Uncharacterized protein n=1 Tax=Orientia chuto str. Dubai TaxID=1359168 RepID=A0A0F3MJY5_9RICK|nr:hypothetical protein OCHUTO_1066 [Orientia chuto str. Dubai]KJV55777.1 hypothetical protein OCHUTO_0717 [Orientia chuto str. Dubai]